MYRKLIKAICAVLLTGISICQLAGCQSYLSEELPTTAYEDKFPDFQYDSSKSPYYQSSNQSLAIAEDGYYIDLMSYTGARALGYSAGQTKNMLCYYNVNSGECLMLCSKIGCKHGNKDCEAVFSTYEDDSVGGKSGFVYYNKRLYMVTYGKDKGTRLMSYNQQGLEEKEELVLYGDPNYRPRVGGANGFSIYDGYVYYWVVKYDLENRIAKNVLCSRKLDGTGEVNTILTIDENGEQYEASWYSRIFGDMYPTNGALYVMTYLYNSSNEIATQEIYKIDKGGSTPQNILKADCPLNEKNRSVDDSYMNLYNVCIDNNNHMYYVDCVNQKRYLYVYDLKTGKEQLLHTFEGRKDMISVLCDDAYVYLNIYGQMDVSDTMIMIFDRTGKAVYQREVKKSQVDLDSGSKGPGGAEIIGVDERYVIMRCDYQDDFDFNDEIVTIEIGNGSTLTMHQRTDVAKIAILPKSELGTGNEKWIEAFDGMLSK